MSTSPWDCQDIWVFPDSPDSPLSQCVLVMESVTNPVPRQTGALLDPRLQEGFSHRRSSSVLAQPRGLVLLHQPGPCMDGGEQLSQLIMAHGHRGEGHKGVLPPWVPPSTLSLPA